MRKLVALLALVALAACTPDPGSDEGEKDDDPCVASAELCNGADDDCDGVVDEDAGDRIPWYSDADADGWGAGAPALACVTPDGAAFLDGDCDDAQPTVHPDADEHCNNRDDDCDGATDEAGAVGGATAYADADADGHGDPEVSVAACALPAGFVANADDCDDGDEAVHPGAPEVCDGVDQDCDGSDVPTWYADVDGDGFGDPAAAVSVCDRPDDHVADANDCDDADAGRRPDAVELARDGVDQDCDGIDRCTDLSPWMGNLTLSTEAEMEGFCAAYDAVDGNLTVQDAEVTDLSALACLCEISGSLSIEDLELLERLDGLEDLARINGELSIYDNNVLESVTALGALDTLGALRIRDNRALADLVGFEGVGALTYYLDIGPNNAVVDLTGLDNLTTVGTDLSISGNRALTSLHGLDSLTSVGGSVDIDSTWLPDLRGLGGLVSVGGVLDVDNNYTLTSLDGLDALTSLGALSLSYNDVLVDISALGLITMLPNSLSLYSNRTLRDPRGLHAMTTIGGDVIMRANRGASPLTSIGLDAVTSIGSGLLIDGLDDVTNLRGLASLTTVGGFFYLDGLDALTSLGGLEQLRSVGSRLRIDANMSLGDVSAAHGIELVDENLEVTDNVSLATADAEALRDAIVTITGSSTISGNAP